MKYARSLSVSLTICFSLTGCGGGAGSSSDLPDIDEFSASQEEISAYLYSSSDLSIFYGGIGYCLPRRENRTAPFDGELTYKDLAEFFGRASGSLYLIENPNGGRSKDKKRSAEDYIEAFEWSSKLDSAVPDQSICLPTIDAYRESGPIPQEKIVQRIKARKRGDAIRERVAGDLAKIAAPEEPGLYLVTNDLELIHVPSLGSQKLRAVELVPAEFPARYQSAFSPRPDEETNIDCVKHPDKPKSIASGDLYGIYLRGTRGFAKLTFGDDSVTVHCENMQEKGFTDFVASHRGFGASATRDSDRLYWFQGKQEPGDTFTVETKKGQSVFEVAEVAVFQVD